MTQRKAANGLDFETLQLGIEHCDPELILGFYAEGAELSIVNAGPPQGSPFQLRGKAEIAKHLRAVFGQEASHRLQREVIGEDRVTFREACEYPDGGRVLVETTLELRDGMIVRQVDVVARDVQPDREEETGRGPPGREPVPLTRSGADVASPDGLLRTKQATEKEDSR
jgi:hypothetical protein